MRIISSKLLKFKIILFNKIQVCEGTRSKDKDAACPSFFSLFRLYCLSLSLLNLPKFICLFYLSFPYFIYVLTVFLFRCLIYLCLSSFPNFIYVFTVFLFRCFIYLCLSVFSMFLFSDTLVIVFLLYLDIFLISLPFFLGSTFT